MPFPFSRKPGAFGDQKPHGHTPGPDKTPEQWLQEIQSKNIGSRIITCEHKGEQFISPRHDAQHGGQYFTEEELRARTWNETKKKGGVSLILCGMCVSNYLGNQEEHDAIDETARRLGRKK